MKNSSDVWADGGTELFHAEGELISWQRETEGGDTEAEGSGPMMPAFGAFRNDLARDEASSMPSIPRWAVANPLAAEWNQVATRWRELGGRWAFTYQLPAARRPFAPGQHPNHPSVRVLPGVWRCGACGFWVFALAPLP